MCVRVSYASDSGNCDRSVRLPPYHYCSELNRGTERNSRQTDRPGVFYAGVCRSGGKRDFYGVARPTGRQWRPVAGADPLRFDETGLGRFANALRLFFVCCTAFLRRALFILVAKKTPLNVFRKMTKVNVYLNFKQLFS